MNAIYEVSVAVKNQCCGYQRLVTPKNASLATAIFYSCLNANRAFFSPYLFSRHNPLVGRIAHALLIASTVALTFYSVNATLLMAISSIAIKVLSNKLYDSDQLRQEILVQLFGRHIGYLIDSFVPDEVMPSYYCLNENTATLSHVTLTNKNINQLPPTITAVGFNSCDLDRVDLSQLLDNIKIVVFINHDLTRINLSQLTPGRIQGVFFRNCHVSPECLGQLSPTIEKVGFSRCLPCDLSLSQLPSKMNLLYFDDFKDLSQVNFAQLQPTVKDIIFSRCTLTSHIDFSQLPPTVKAIWFSRCNLHDTCLSLLATATINFDINYGNVKASMTGAQWFDLVQPLSSGKVKFNSHSILPSVLPLFVCSKPICVKNSGS